jgi:hypothetical protein
VKDFSNSIDGTCCSSWLGIWRRRANSSTIAAATIGEKSPYQQPYTNGVNEASILGRRFNAAQSIPTHRRSVNTKKEEFVCDSQKTTINFD